jgi:hypothetical protein
LIVEYSTSRPEVEVVLKSLSLWVEEEERRTSGRVYKDGRAGTNGVSGKQVRDVDRKANPSPLATRVVLGIVCTVTGSLTPDVAFPARRSDRGR